MRAKPPIRLLAFSLAAATLLSLDAVSSLHAQTVRNGSFENPALPPPYAYGTSEYWTALGDAFVITNDYGLGTTPYGNQWQLIYPDATVAQIISGPFSLDATYTLSFAAAATGNSADYQLTVIISGGATATQIFAVPGRPGNTSPDPLPFVTYTLAFTPTTDNPVIIAFADTSLLGRLLAVDNVQLTVPEPSTWALSVVGFVGLGFARYRRQCCTHVEWRFVSRWSGGR